LRLFFNRLTNLGVASWVCWLLALGSVALAFPGPERSGAFMARPVMQGVTAVLAAALLFCGLRALGRRRPDSALLHAGCACVLAGWLWGQHAVRTATPERPVNGSMAMVDGEVSDTLWSGPYLTNYVGRVSFTLKLERFIVEYYDQNGADRDAGRMPPVREYRSRVTVTEPDKAPYVANVRVNQPLRVQGYHIYQMSWGQTSDRMGRPMVYTVLQFIRDPGLPLVYAGFALLFLGTLLFTVRVFRVKPPELKGVAP